MGVAVVATPARKRSDKSTRPVAAVAYPLLQGAGQVDRIGKGGKAAVPPLNLAGCSNAARSSFESLRDSPSFDNVNYGLAGAMAVHSPCSSARGNASRPLL